MDRDACYLLGERTVVMQFSAPATLECQQRIWWVAQRLGRHDYDDVVPGMNNLTVFFNPARDDGGLLLTRLKQLWSSAKAHSFKVREVVIPVFYGGEDGPDLDVVARHTAMTPTEVIEAHCKAVYTVFFLGFQPGFAYLGGLPTCLETPRLATPRLIVPAGSVGIGGVQTGIYPQASPGGWNLIGRSELDLFDPTRDSPSLLLPGDLVHFSPIGGNCV
ncbi:TPA: 5-oxoprolinase subunit PxpB [Aeromonas dhakensis]|uniref:5-oxoprolinase subunit PxpB n=1 Tax=Aeromonas dhakensis TaxID=196024 RepID=UPI00289048C1|nr:5-oxoprolinase subunit PxpB [Aeromonas dhakensis]